MLSVLRGEVEEREQRVRVLLQSRHRLRILRAVLGREPGDRLTCLLARLGVHHLVQRGLHARLESLWQFVEDVAEFVKPIALLARLRPHVPHGDPEAEGAIAHDNYGWAHTSALQIAENGLPAFGALAVA